MKDLIPIQTDNDGIQTVNARDIHRYVESKQDFSHWIKDRIEKAGFIEGADFTIILSKSTGGRPMIEYHASLDMGKELGMLEQNDKGREIRQFFIEADKERRRQAVIMADFQTAILAKIESIIEKKFNKMIASDLTSLDVRKADETVHAMGYDKLSHGERVAVMSAIKKRATEPGEYVPMRYAELRDYLFRTFGVTAFVNLMKRDFKNIMLFIARYDYKSRQLTIETVMRHLTLAK
jgi:anti-repressor protein